jgi:osmotically-inducible protein OsmY
MSLQTGILLFLAAVLVLVVPSRLRPAPKEADLAITAAINEAVTREFPLGNFQVDVKTFDGAVQLGGFTREYEQSKRIEEIARAVPGVKSVTSSIWVRPGN